MVHVYTLVHVHIAYYSRPVGDISNGDSIVANLVVIMCVMATIVSLDASMQIVTLVDTNCVQFEFHHLSDEFRVADVIISQIGHNHEDFELVEQSSMKSVNTHSLRFFVL